MSNYTGPGPRRIAGPVHRGSGRPVRGPCISPDGRVPSRYRSAAPFPANRVGTLRSQSRLFLVAFLALAVTALVVLLWWQSDPHTAREIWNNDKGSLLQFGIPPALAGA